VLTERKAHSAFLTLLLYTRTACTLLQAKDDQDLVAAVRYIRRVELQAPPLVAFNDEVTPPLELPALQPGQKHLEPRSLSSSASAAAAVCIVGGWQRSNKVLLSCYSMSQQYAVL
jgi:hypothetical protein